jgi:hypothetical protein
MQITYAVSIYRSTAWRGWPERVGSDQIFTDRSQALALATRTAPTIAHDQEVEFVGVYRVEAADGVDLRSLNDWNSQSTLEHLVHPDGHSEPAGSHDLIDSALTAGQRVKWRLRMNGFHQPPDDQMIVGTYVKLANDGAGLTLGSPAAFSRRTWTWLVYEATSVENVGSGRKPCTWPPPQPSAPASYPDR